MALCGLLLETQYRKIFVILNVIICWSSYLIIARLLLLDCKSVCTLKYFNKYRRTFIYLKTKYSSNYN